MMASLNLGLDHPVSARLYSGAADAPRRPVLVLAHGAGAPQGHPFMVAMASALAERGLDVWTFNFPYMDAGRRLPDKLPILVACFAAMAADVMAAGEGRRVFLGGKSMGGRVATHVAAHASLAPQLAGIVCLGYPLRPPGSAATSQRPEGKSPRARTDRTSHLAHLRVPTLVVQGTRDPFGGPDDIRAAFGVAPALVTVVPVEGGGHSFEVPRRGGISQDAVYAAVATAIAGWTS